MNTAWAKRLTGKKILKRNLLAPQFLCPSRAPRGAEEMDGIGESHICFESDPTRGQYRKRLGKKIYGQEDSKTKSSCPSIFLPIRASMQGEEMAGIGAKLKYMLGKPIPGEIWKTPGQKDLRARRF
jgi:hypothetical protein